MPSFDDLRTKGTEELSRLTEPQIEDLRSTYPALPESYLRFLEELGWGDLGGHMMVYSGPVLPDEVLDAIVAESLPPHLLLIGDDYQGYCYGLTENGEVVEVSPRGEIDDLARDFEDFIREAFRRMTT
jgi:hypothetical protein